VGSKSREARAPQAEC